MDIWRESPGAAVIADFEYCSRLVSRLKHLAIFEIALSNAEGKWVVPPTTINHSMPVGELAKLIHTAGRQYGLDSRQMNINLHSVKKFYRQADWTRETEGSTWAEIAQMIEKYVEDNGNLRVFMEWGRTQQDYNCLKYGLESVGKAHLLPPSPRWPERPIAWWDAVRRRMGWETSDAPLGLGVLFGAIYEEEAEFASKWHHAGPDVEMTIKLIETYFSQACKQPIRAVIESHEPGPEEEDETPEEELDWSDSDDDEDENVFNTMSWEEMVEAGFIDDEDTQ